MATDNKYGKISVEKEPGNPFGEDEPVFLLRGRDTATPMTVRNYAQMASRRGASEEFVAAVYARASEIERWQVANPDLVKIPD